MSTCIYFALDCSSSVALRSFGGSAKNGDKFGRALNFAAAFVDELTTASSSRNCNFEIDLISFTSTPKIVKKCAKTRDDVFGSFPTTIITAGKLDFLALRDLVLSQNPQTNFEFVLVLDASCYKWVSPSFQLPCPMHFVMLSDGAVDSALLCDLRIFSEPLFLCRDEDAVTLAQQLTKMPRTHDSATLMVSSSQRIRVHLFPSMQRSTLISYDCQITKLVPSSSSDSSNFRLLGFAKGETLMSIPSSSICHILTPEDSTITSDNWAHFHLLAEALGEEGQVAVMQNEKTEEEYVIKPYRDDPSHLWILCLQLIPSSSIRWYPVQEPPTPSKVQFPEVSYKLTASTRIHWTDQHGIQSDIQRLQRLLKKADRTEQFKKEMQRLAMYAMAFGYHDFAQTLAEILERKLTSIPEENKAILQKTTKMLREGGFKQVMQLK